jgi:hypothetical protein
VTVNLVPRTNLRHGVAGTEEDLAHGLAGVLVARGCMTSPTMPKI